MDMLSPSFSIRKLWCPFRIIFSVRTIVRLKIEVQIEFYIQVAIVLSAITIDRLVE
jgi:hypothetical protein